MSSRTYFEYMVCQCYEIYDPKMYEPAFDTKPTSCAMRGKDIERERERESKRELDKNIIIKNKKVNVKKSG